MPYARKLSQAFVALVTGAVLTVAPMTASATADSNGSAAHPEANCFRFDDLNEVVLSVGWYVNKGVGLTPVIGDIGYYTDDLYLPDGKKLGTVSAVVVVSYLRPKDDHMMIFLDETVTLPGGTVTDAGFVDDTTSLEGVTQSIPVKTATGRYAGMSGARTYLIVSRTLAHSSLDLCRR